MPIDAFAETYWALERLLVALKQQAGVGHDAELSQAITLCKEQATEAHKRLVACVGHTHGETHKVYSITRGEAETHLKMLDNAVAQLVDKVQVLAQKILPLPANPDQRVTSYIDKKDSPEMRERKRFYNVLIGYGQCIRLHISTLMEQFHQEMDYLAEIWKKRESKAKSSG